jgi:hypothetical protein
MFYTTEEAEKDIVSFDQALELCSIGFDTSTFCHYTIETRQLCLSSLDEDGFYMPDKDIAAPTKSQVFRWFREKHNMLANVYSNASGFLFEYHDTIGGTHRLDSGFTGDCELSGTFTTYEKAEDACIDQLILLAKQQDK